jgi:hypothetical protein
MSEHPMPEMEALRAYFDAHMEMQAAIDAEKFGRAYVKANQARDTLLQLEEAGPTRQRVRYSNELPWERNE